MSRSARNRVTSQRAQERDRVHITFDLYTGGAMRGQEIPFVTGVMADLSGASTKARPAVAKRKFSTIDLESFDKRMAEIAPSVRLSLDPEGNEAPVEIVFESMEDFLPESVARKVPHINEMLEKRERLARLLAMADGHEASEKLLMSLVEQPGLRRAATAVLETPEKKDPAPGSGKLATD